VNERRLTLIIGSKADSRHRPTKLLLFDTPNVAILRQESLVLNKPKVVDRPYSDDSPVACERLLLPKFNANG
jgi:hypothetical protein